MARYAIISDIHGNLHALEATLRALTSLNISEIICLGDVVGYGPSPDQCIDLVSKCCSIVIEGNHDAAAVDLSRSAPFNGAAREALEWTRGVLGPMHLAALNSYRRVDYVGNNVMCVHDCPVPGPTDYINDKQVAAMAFRGVDLPICLVGHTHVPMVFEAPTANVEDELTPTDITAYVMRDAQPVEFVEGRRYICNPGSVGQPRDCDARASFAILDTGENTFTVHRAAYDVAAAQADTLRAGLPTVLADRLAIGA